MTQNLAGRKESFACAACGEDFGRETAVVECRVCHRSYCDECLDDQGTCVPCEGKKS